MGDTGHEQPQKVPGKQQNGNGAAHTVGTVTARNEHATASNGADVLTAWQRLPMPLRVAVTNWDRLPEPIRAAVLAVLAVGIPGGKV